MIRSETPGDAPAIHAVHVAAFPTDLEARLVDLLREAGRTEVSLVAVHSDVVVGHVLLTRVEVERGEGGLGLAPVAVAPAEQRRGIAAALIRAALEEARAQGFAFVVVLGDPAYYHRFGFARAAAFGLSNAYGADEEFMALELTPGALARTGGLVQYAPEFASVVP